MSYCLDNRWLVLGAIEGTNLVFFENPLENSNEAIMLLMHIGARLSDTVVEVSVRLNDNVFTEPKGFDSCAATRRAIVRAAASLSTKDD
jgi:hypothetical protein